MALTAGLVAGAAILPARSARADDVAVACIAAHTAGQVARRGGHFRDAQRQFVQCARDSCPTEIRKDCASWSLEMARDAPTVVLDAHDADGKQVDAVRVWIDGEAIAEGITGTALTVDPGAHTFRFVDGAGQERENRATILEGEKLRRIAVEFSSSRAPRAAAAAPGPTATEPTPAPPARSGPPVGAFVAGAIAVAGAGSFTYFAIRGKSLERDLSSRCAPHCDDADAATVRRDYLAADISLGVTVVATAIAVYLAWPRARSTGTAATAPVGVAPLPGGAKLIWERVF